MDTGVQISVQARAFNFGGYRPRSGIAGSNGNSVYYFEESPYAFHSSFGILHSHQQCPNVPVLHILTSTCYCLSFFLLLLLNGLIFAFLFF